MQLFHYHLVTSEVRDVEARYVGKLGFDLVARYGRIGDEHVSVEAGVSWEQLDRDGFKLRLSELERGAVNVVLQPGHWECRGSTTSASRSTRTSSRPCSRARAQWNLRVQEHGGRRTFVSTNAGYRLEVHPPRDWIDELLERAGRLLVLTELHLRADEPEAKARALAELLDVRGRARTRCRSATRSSGSCRAGRGPAGARRGALRLRLPKGRP